MKTAFRIILTILVFFAAYYFIYWLPLSLLPAFHKIDYLPQIISLLIAIGLSVFIWKKTATAANSLAVQIIKGGIIVGAIGFIIGFIGPLIFGVGGNLGPLYGIFITGPFGFLIGLIGGAINWLVKSKRKVPVL